MSASTATMMSASRVRTSATRRGGCDSQRRRTRGIAPQWLAPIAWALALACLIAAVGVLPSARDLVPRRASAAIEVRVASSDTLWSIAAKHRIPGATTAETVAAIMEANGLANPALRVGTVLSVPSADAPVTAFAQVSEPSSFN